MPSIKRKIASMAGEYIGRGILKKISDVTKELENWTSKNPLNARNANPTDEDEYMKNYNSKKQIPFPSRKPQLPMQRDVSTWSKTDLETVMQSRDYQYDVGTQRKVQSYFEWKYPGKQKLDATGRPVK